MKNVRLIISMLATLLLGNGASVSVANQFAEADQVQTESKGNEKSTPPASILDVVKPNDVKSAAADKPASPRHFSTYITDR
jgi:hypothetical protein